MSKGIPAFPGMKYNGALSARLVEREAREARKGGATYPVTVSTGGRMIPRNAKPDALRKQLADFLSDMDACGCTVGGKAVNVNGVSVPTSVVVPSSVSLTALSRHKSGSRQEKRPAEAAQAALPAPAPPAAKLRLPAAFVKEASKRGEAWGEQVVAAAKAISKDDAIAGKSVRELQVPGSHAKFLENSVARGWAFRLAGRPDEADGVRRGHKARHEYAILDPLLRDGGPRHRIWVEGDPLTRPTFVPRVVFLIENSDAFDSFPDVPGCLAVYVNGSGARHVAKTVPFVRSAPVLCFYGDMDSAGYMALNALRAERPGALSLCMGTRDFLLYQWVGSVYDEKGNPYVPPAKADLTRLTDDERVVYDLFYDPTHKGPNRIEQERLDLSYVSMRAHDVASATETTLATRLLLSASAAVGNLAGRAAARIGFRTRRA